jgi:hypothetical protein
VDIEKMMTTIRAGGSEGLLAFFKIATEFFEAGWQRYLGGFEDARTILTSPFGWLRNEHK